jgi:hypothetical protein
MLGAAENAYSKNYVAGFDTEWHHLSTTMGLSGQNEYPLHVKILTLQDSSLFPHSPFCTQCTIQSNISKVYKCFVYFFMQVWFSCKFFFKGQCHEIFKIRLFNESVSPKPLRIPLRLFQFFCKFAEIFTAQGALPVSLHQWQMEKIFIQKV